MSNYKKFLITFLSLSLATVLLYGIVLAAAGQPTVTGVNSTKANGSYKAGDTVPIQITFSSSVDVSTGSLLRLSLNSAANASATYTSGTGSTTLTFTYTILAGQTSSDLDYSTNTALSLNGGAILLASNHATSAIVTLAEPGAAGSLGANKNIVIDTGTPTVTIETTSATISKASAGQSMGLVMTFNEAMSTATPILITFSPDVAGSGSLTLSTSSWYNSGLIYNATYTIADVVESQYDIDVVVSSSTDLAGNLVATTTSADLIDLDTVAPESIVVLPPASSYGERIGVTLTSTGSTFIKYNTSGATPTCWAGTSYGGAISLSTSTTVKAIACDALYNSSAVSTTEYTLTVVTGGGGGSSAGYYSATPAIPAVPATPAVPGVSPAIPATPATPAISAAQAQLTALMTQLQALIAQAKSSGVNIPASASALLNASANAAFNRSLTLGSNGDDVKSLQVFLNTHGFAIASAGPGSLGNETTRFGSLTRAALAKFQTANGITPAAGYFGPLTMKYLKAAGY